VVAVIGGAADDGGSRRSCCSFFFFFLPCAKAQTSVFPPRLLLFVLLCLSFYPSFSLSFWSLISLSSLSLLFFFVFLLSILLYFSPLCLCSPLSLFLYVFLSLLFSSILIVPLNSQNPPLFFIRL